MVRYPIAFKQWVIANFQATSMYNVSLNKWANLKRGNLHESDSIILRVVLAIIDVHQQFITMKKQKFGSYSKIMFVCSCGW